METVTLPHLPDRPLQIGLIKDVENAAFLREQLLAGNSEFEYAFLDATVLLSRNHVLAACFRAINDQNNNRLKSRNVHSEIVFSLSPNNNIAESFRRFGIQDASKHIVVVKVGSTKATVQEHIKQHVKGKTVPFSDETLSSLRDDARIRKLYKLDAPKKGESAQLTKQAETSILSQMALRGS